MWSFSFVWALGIILVFTSITDMARDVNIKQGSLLTGGIKSRLYCTQKATAVFSATTIKKYNLDIIHLAKELRKSMCLLHHINEVLLHPKMHPNLFSKFGTWDLYKTLPSSVQGHCRLKPSKGSIAGSLYIHGLWRPCGAPSRTSLLQFILL